MYRQKLSLAHITLIAFRKSIYELIHHLAVGSAVAQHGLHIHARQGCILVIGQKSAYTHIVIMSPAVCYRGCDKLFIYGRAYGIAACIACCHRLHYCNKLTIGVNERKRRISLLHLYVKRVICMRVE